MTVWVVYQWIQGSWEVQTIHGTERSAERQADRLRDKSPVWVYSYPLIVEEEN